MEDLHQHLPVSEMHMSGIYVYTCQVYIYLGQAMLMNIKNSSGTLYRCIQCLYCTGAQEECTCMPLTPTTCDERCN